MKTDQNRRKFLSEYRAPDFTIKTTRLNFDIDEQQTRVSSRLNICRKTDDATAALHLDGVGLKLLSVSIDSVALQSQQYEVTATHLIVFNVPDEFEFSPIIEVGRITREARNVRGHKGLW